MEKLTSLEKYRITEPILQSRASISIVAKYHDIPMIFLLIKNPSTLKLCFPTRWDKYFGKKEWKFFTNFIPIIVCFISAYNLQLCLKLKIELIHFLPVNPRSIYQKLFDYW